MTDLQESSTFEGKSLPSVSSYDYTAFLQNEYVRVQSSPSLSSSSSSSSIFSEVDSVSSVASSAASSSVIAGLSFVWKDEDGHDNQDAKCVRNSKNILETAKQVCVQERSDQSNVFQTRSTVQSVHPRRTKHSSRGWPDVNNRPSLLKREPPSLLRESDRKINFVDRLVDTAANLVELIWPCAATVNKSKSDAENMLSLKMFIQEILKRSRTSYSTLQVALYYLYLLWSRLPLAQRSIDGSETLTHGGALYCGRRMFLSALILASKYLQDKNFSARAWSKISGLLTSEINSNEIAFLSAVGWRLHISESTYSKWTNLILEHTPDNIFDIMESCNDERLKTKFLKDLLEFESVSSSSICRGVTKSDARAFLGSTGPTLRRVAESFLTKKMKVDGILNENAPSCKILKSVVLEKDCIMSSIQKISTNSPKQGDGVSNNEASIQNTNFSSTLDKVASEIDHSAGRETVITGCSPVENGLSIPANVSNRQDPMHNMLVSTSSKKTSPKTKMEACSPPRTNSGGDGFIKPAFTSIEVLSSQRRKRQSDCKELVRTDTPMSPFNDVCESRKRFKASRIDAGGNCAPYTCNDNNLTRNNGLIISAPLLSPKQPLTCSLEGRGVLKLEERVAMPIFQ